MGDEVGESQERFNELWPSLFRFGDAVADEEVVLLLLGLSARKEESMGVEDRWLMLWSLMARCSMLLVKARSYKEESAADLLFFLDFFDFLLLLLWLLLASSLFLFDSASFSSLSFPPPPLNAPGMRVFRGESTVCDILRVVHSGDSGCYHHHDTSLITK